MQMINKCSTYKKTHPFWHLVWKHEGLQFPKNNSKVYSVLRIIVLQIQKNLSSRTKVIAGKPLHLQTDVIKRDPQHNTIAKYFAVV